MLVGVGKVVKETIWLRHRVPNAAVMIVCAWCLFCSGFPYISSKYLIVRSEEEQKRPDVMPRSRLGRRSLSPIRYPLSNSQCHNIRYFVPTTLHRAEHLLTNYLSTSYFPTSLQDALFFAAYIQTLHSRSTSICPT